MKKTLKLIIILGLTLLLLIGCNMQEPDYGIVIGKEHVNKKCVSRYSPVTHMTLVQSIPEKWMVEIKYYYPEGKTKQVKVSIDKEVWDNVKKGDSARYEKLTEPSFVRRRD